MDGLEQTRALDIRIAELAERQHGVVARRQLVGLGEDAVEWRLRMGRLHRLHRGVYAVGHKVLSRKGRWMAAVLYCGPDAALSHRSAAALWGIREPSSGAIEVTIPRKSRSRESIRRHRAVLAADELTTAAQIPVTTVPRTLLDLSASLPTDRLEQTLRQSERLRIYDTLSLGEMLARHPRHRGARSIRECLRRRRDAPPGVTREELEARFLAFLDRAGLPRPRLNAWLSLRDRRYQADCLWRDRSLIVELDGYASHGTRIAFEDDRERDRILQVEGWRVIRVTWQQLHESGGKIAADLRRLLRPEI
jgi:hypothetical protein